MASETHPRPTQAELEILRVLWQVGPGTVRQVHREMNRRRQTGYTTVLKLMQIMTDKGLLQRDRSVRPQVYSVTRSEGQTQAQLVGDLLERAFGGSPGNLVLQALSDRPVSSEERRQIRELLDRLEGDDS